MGALLVSSYIIGWLVVFGTFVRFYHRRKAEAMSQLQPWFGDHKYKQVYISLLQVEPPVDEFLLKSALLRRAMTVVDRVLQLREQKPPLSQLMKAGSIGEEVWNQFLKAESEIEQEVMEVIEEANTFND